MQGLFFKIRIQIMYKLILLPFLAFGMGLMPLKANSSIEKRLQESQSVFPEELFLLTSLIEELLVSNPGIKIIQAKLNASKAEENAASQALYNPELEMDYENSEINVSTLGIIQTIDWSDKRGGRSKVALVNKQRNKVGLRIAQEKLSGQLLQSLSNYHTAQDKEALVKLRIELLQEFVTLVNKRYQSGDVNQSQLSLAKLAYAEASMQRTRIASELMKSKQLLIALTGHDNAQWPGLTINLPVSNINSTTIDELMTDLPVMKEQALRIAAAMAKVKLRSLEQNADPTIGIRAGREDSDTLIGFSLSIPLNVRNTYRARVQVANAQLIQTQYAHENLQRQIKSQLFSSSLRYQLVHETWNQWKKIGQASMINQFSLIHQQWQTSEISATDYYLQLNQTLDTRLSEIELRHELWSAWIGWLKTSSRVLHWLKIK
jgi:cobalt-zinc-cadmium efflux system outer membrane protein